MDPHKQQAVDYIRQQKQQGFTDDAIRQSLSASGWAGSALDEILHLSSSTPSINPDFAQFIPTQDELNPSSNKSFGVAWVLSLFLGGLGVDRFYLGYTKLGILKLLTLGGFGVWYIIDFILTGFGKQRDVHGKPVQPSSRNAGLFKVLSIVCSIMVLTMAVIVGVLVSEGSKSEQDGSASTTASDESATMNTAEGGDVYTIYTAFQKFKDDHNGAAPKSFVPESDTVLKMCGDSCDAKQSVSIELKNMNPEHVLLEQYTDGIEVDEDTRAYVVLGAQCNASIEENEPLIVRDDNASVLLFATEDTDLGAIVPQCVSFS